MVESEVQNILTRWALLRKNHTVVVPNSTMLLTSEADLISVTRAGFVHEYEIKCSRADYNKEIRALKGKGKRNYRKRRKHIRIKNAERSRHNPNYFWFVTTGFDVDVPKHVGWIEIVDGHVKVRKKAPRIHDLAWNDAMLAKAAHILSFRVMNSYG